MRQILIGASPTALLVFGGILSVLGIGCNLFLRSLVREARAGTLEGIADRVEGLNSFEGFGEVEHPAKWPLILGSLLFFPGFLLLVLGFFRL